MFSFVESRRRPLSFIHHISSSLLHFLTSSLPRFLASPLLQLLVGLAGEHLAVDEEGDETHADDKDDAEDEDDAGVLAGPVAAAGELVDGVVPGNQALDDRHCEAFCAS